MLFSMAYCVCSYVVERVEPTLWFRTAYQTKGSVRTRECVKLDNGLRLVNKPVIYHARVFAKKKLGDYNIDREKRQQFSWQVTKVVATVNGMCQYSELSTASSTRRLRRNGRIRLAASCHPQTHVLSTSDRMIS